MSNKDLSLNQMGANRGANAVADALLARPDLGLHQVAVVDPKVGSGKTALADMIALGAGAAIDDEASFLVKAQEHISREQVGLSWSNGEASETRSLSSLRPVDAWHAQPQVRYLSQQFVDRLCSSSGLADDLIAEIENVVFRAIPASDRLGEPDFNSLRVARLEQVNRRREERLRRIETLTDVVAQEEAKQRSIPLLKLKVKDAHERETKLLKQIADLTPKGKQEKAQQLQDVSKALTEREQRIERVKTTIALGDRFVGDMTDLSARWKREFEDLKARYAGLGLTAVDWASVQPVFPTGAPTVAGSVKTRLREQLKQLEQGDPAQPRDPLNYATWPLAELQSSREALTKDLGVEKERVKALGVAQKSAQALAKELLDLDSKLKDAETADGRRRGTMAERRATYAEVFSLFAEEQTILEELYAPLGSQLATSAGSEKRLEFYVQRVVDLDAWVRRGEDLFDLRKAGPLQGRGSLQKIALAELMPAWQRGDGEAVASAMDGFLRSHGQGITAAKKAEVSLRTVAEWLFATDHIRLSYGIRFDDVEISKLSPGMRGVVLLLLYLAVDEWDTRPLIVDQPEENLDPQSIYKDLVGYFRKAKQRRQVILVTHNPNLVVNADADQVIVTSSVRDSAERLPLITYTSGGLEDPEIRKAVCDVLEGGERAFRERERRYALPRDPRSRQ